MSCLANLAMATLPLAMLAMLAAIPGCQNRASSEAITGGESKPENPPVPQTGPHSSEASADHVYVDLLAQGDAYNQQGEFATAIDQYTQAIDLDPQRADGYAKRAAALVSTGSTRTAAFDYSRAIRRSPSDPELYLDRAKVQLACKQSDKALADCNTAVRLSPKLVRAHLYRANVHLGRGEFDAAIEDYNSALAIMPNSASAYCNRGIAYRSKGELARAIADYTSAIRYNTSFAEAYNNRGEIYLRQEKYDQAMADFNQALHIDPAEFDAYDNRGDLNLLLGKPEAAIKDYTRIIDRALQTAAKGTDLHPGARLAEIYRKRASAHLKADQPHEAVVDAGEALEINPDDARAYAIRRDAYRKLGQTELAEADDNRASRLQHTGSAR